MSLGPRKARRLYEEFHSFKPKKIGSFGRGFRIPKKARYVGEAKMMYYSSDKLNPVTGEDEGVISYYHPHEGGVRMYLTDSSQGGDVRNVPGWIHNNGELVKLGDCEGFDFEDFYGELVEAKSKGIAPEWYAIPSGKALLVIQSKKKVVAILWGGSLRVEWRGVVG